MLLCEYHLPLRLLASRARVGLLRSLRFGPVGLERTTVNIVKIRLG